MATLLSPRFLLRLSLMPGKHLHVPKTHPSKSLLSGFFLELLKRHYCLPWSPFRCETISRAVLTMSH